jgi:hypothetical protein
MSDDATVGHCIVEGCGKPMISKWAWTQGVRREGHVSAGAQGICRKHYVRLQRTGTTDLVPRTREYVPRTSDFRPRREVLEDYLMIKSDVSSIAQAAERMGMTASALDMALYRARRDGHEEATPPLNQVLRQTG